MGLFSGIFGNSGGAKQEQKQLPWIHLTSVLQLEEIEKRSTTKPQLIFKHSTTCGISRMVLKMFTEVYDFEDNVFDLYYLDLHKYRDVSNETGYKFQVIHQSPQLLVIKNGVTIADASHGGINEIKLENYR